MKTAPAKSAGPTFEDLVRSIHEVDQDLAAQARRAVHGNTTLRNWAIGCNIVEYEQRGEDRASYGERLLATLSDRPVQDGVSRSEERELRRYRPFYQTYPQIRETLAPELRKSLEFIALGTPVSIREPAAPEFGFSGKKLITRLSFTHFVELLAVDDPLKRSFYEAECIRGNWGVRQLIHEPADAFRSRREGEAPAEPRGKARQEPRPPETRQDQRVRV